VNERTIAQMIADAQTLAAANQKLTSRIVAAETEFVDELSAINALDLESDIGDVKGLETKVNDGFFRSIDVLRTSQNNSLVAGT
jgi:hypothetical protein